MSAKHPTSNSTHSEYMLQPQRRSVRQALCTHMHITRRHFPYRLIGIRHGPVEGHRNCPAQKVQRSRCCWLIVIALWVRPVEQVHRGLSTKDSCLTTVSKPNTLHGDPSLVVAVCPDELFRQKAEENLFPIRLQHRREAPHGTL
jgi:hypothetical protein